MARRGSLGVGAGAIADIPDLSIKVESPFGDTVRALIRRDAPEECDTLDELGVPNAELLVARNGRTAIGFVRLLDHLRFGEARRLYVDPKARGNGIAAALVHALEDAVREIGLRVLTVTPRDDGQMSHDRFARFGHRRPERAGARAGAPREKRL